MASPIKLRLNCFDRAMLSVVEFLLYILASREALGCMLNLFTIWFSDLDFSSLGFALFKPMKLATVPSCRLSISFLSRSRSGFNSLSEPAFASVLTPAGFQGPKALLWSLSNGSLWSSFSTESDEKSSFEALSLNLSILLAGLFLGLSFGRVGRKLRFFWIGLGAVATLTFNTESCSMSLPLLQIEVSLGLSGGVASPSRIATWSPSWPLILRRLVISFSCRISEVSPLS